MPRIPSSMGESRPPPIETLDQPPPEPSRLGIGGRILWAATSVLTRLLQFAFHLLYYPLAFTYDAVAWIVSAGEWAEWRRCVLPVLPPGPVLEIGHGTGTLSLDMSERGFAVTAIDLSPAMGKIASAKKRAWKKRRPGGSASASGKIDGPVLVRADVTRLPFRNNSFSSAVATFPADFLFQHETLRGVHRVLRPGGRWIILPTASPEWLARRWLSDDRSIAANPLWRAFLPQMEECGFSTAMKIVRRPRSRVLVILADKP